MHELNLPKYDFKYKKENDEKYIFDEIRNKFLVLTPEEFVRQHFIKFLINDKKFPKNLLAVEYKIEINKNIRRCDIVVFDKKIKPKLIVECKAPSININQKTFEQIFDYHYELKPEYLIVTNGIVHYYIKSDTENNSYVFLDDIPNFDKL